MGPELIRRNFEAMSQGLKDMRLELEKIKEDGKRKDAIISQQVIEVASMRQQMAILFAKSIGSGATT